MHIYVGRQHIGQPIILHVINDNVRVLALEFSFLGLFCLLGALAMMMRRGIDLDIRTPTIVQRVFLRVTQRNPAVEDWGSSILKASFESKFE